MSYWTYGLIEEKKEIKVAELYFNNEGGLMTYLVLQKKDLKNKSDRQRMVNDIMAQVKLGLIYTEGDLHK